MQHKGDVGVVCAYNSTSNGQQKEVFIFKQWFGWGINQSNVIIKDCVSKTQSSPTFLSLYGDTTNF